MADIDKTHSLVDYRDENSQIFLTTVNDGEKVDPEMAMKYFKIEETSIKLSDIDYDSNRKLSDVIGPNGQIIGKNGNITENEYLEETGDWKYVIF